MSDPALVLAALREIRPLLLVAHGLEPAGAAQRSLEVLLEASA